MIDPNSQLGEILEQGQTVAQNQVQDVTQRLKSQVLGINPKQSTAGSNPVSSFESAAPTPEDASVRTQEVVKDFYSPSDPGEGHTAHDPSKDAEHLSSIRRQLSEMHNATYYDPLFAHETKKKPTIQEEQETEEKQQKMQDLEFQKAKDDQAFAVQLAAQKTERFPGMSG